VNFKNLLDKNEGRCNNVSVKKIKKNPRYFAGRLERIFADHKLCCIYIWLWLAGCQNIRIWGTFFLLFEFFAPNLLQIDPFEYILKSFIFGLLSTVENWVVKSPKSDSQVITKT
jgi:hypothetical protein